MTDISKELQQRAAQVSADELLGRMGYRSVGPKARDRLSRVLADPLQGLDTPEYDFHLASRAFSEALCRALGMDQGDYLPALDAIEAHLEEERTAYKPWLFVDTGFKRSDRPGTAIFILAIMESTRRLRLPPDTFRLPWEQQLQRAQQAVCRHMAESERGRVEGLGAHTALPVLLRRGPDAGTLTERRGGGGRLVDGDLTGQRFAEGQAAAASDSRG
ncbi:hypothetical protein [Halomonas sp.]|uniref:hypothetical protein n=1 Tax=Halomonas sp. TaxID=1486246 RepID=UPI003567CBC5